MKVKQSADSVCMYNDDVSKRGKIIHSQLMVRHMSRIRFAIEGSRTGGKSTAVIIVPQVTSLGRLSIQN